jgi:hypothetical protein
MISTKSFLVFALLVGDVAKPAHSTELQPATIAAWQEYVRSGDARMQARLDTDKPFLWIDETTDRALRVRRGEIVVMPMVGQGTRDVPDGLIHDWIGGVFIPNASIDKLLAIVHDYDRYKEIYRPVVTDSHSEPCAADREFSMTWKRHVLFVNAAIQGRYQAHEFAFGPHRRYSVIDATSIQEIEDYGHSGQRLLPPDNGSGFMWRMHSISRYEQRDGGVYLEVEAIALTRDVPPSLRWMVNPVVHRLSINSLTTTLRQTRQAVNMRSVTPEQLAMRDAEGGN